MKTKCITRVEGGGAVVWQWRLDFPLLMLC